MDIVIALAALVTLAVVAPLVPDRTPRARLPRDAGRQGALHEPDPRPRP